jgi:eukaryotic-like serine/threonine-protein kinase
MSTSITSSGVPDADAASGAWDTTHAPEVISEAKRHRRKRSKSGESKAVVATEQLSTIGVVGRYALKYKISEGGLGCVYAAHDPLLSRLIAIKTLNLEIASEQREAFNAQFLNEARAAGSLSHPNIVTVFDAGVSEQGPYLAMELLRGKDLHQLRLEGWRPTKYQAALLVRRVADALSYAHAKGVIHRDIKPANIFMVGRTQPRILDFGIARIAQQHDTPAADALVGGSPYYMSPEQIAQTHTDKRCDVYSLGVVLYELLTDTRPFRGNSLDEITQAVLTHQPPLAHVLEASVPQVLSEIAAKAMQKKPEDRYSSVRALSRELRRWIESEPQAAPEEPPAQSRRLYYWVWGAAVLCAIALAIAIAIAG